MPNSGMQPGSAVIVNPQVTYDVADLLDRLGTRLDTGFATLIEKLDSKADKADLAAIKGTLDEHAKQIADLQAHRENEQVAKKVVLSAQGRARDWRRWVIEALISAAATGGILAGVLH